MMPHVPGVIHETVMKLYGIGGTLQLAPCKFQHFDRNEDAQMFLFSIPVNNVLFFKAHSAKIACALLRQTRF